MGDITKQVAAISLVIALIISGITYMSIKGDDGDNALTVNLSSIEVDLIGVARGMLQGRSWSDENLSGDMEDEITRRIFSQEIEGLRSMAVEEIEITTLPTTIAADIPTQIPLFEDSRGLSVLNSLMYGSSGPTPLIPGTIVNARITLKAIDSDEIPHSETITFTVTSYDPKDSMEALLDAIDNDVNGWSSGLARDVEYMLNTVTRARTTRGVGTGPNSVPRNVLNEGDVELALNIAVAVRIARWTGQLPDDLVRDIDRFFSDQDHGTTMNPTGFRPWGESEKANFASYSSHRPSRIQESRKISNLLDDILTEGHGDIADIWFNYLYLDGIHEDLHIQNPLDAGGPLEISRMSNPRQQYDTVDPYSLATHVSFPSREGITLSTSSDMISQEEDLFKPELDLRGGYLVSGRDFIISGLNDMDAWYTNVDYTKTINDYTQFAVNTSTILPVRGTTSDEETRCGTILPPPPPPDHDWRLQWDLSLSGEMTLKGLASSWGGNTPTVSSVERSIPFDFNTRVHTWFFHEPSRTDDYNFKNINDPFTDVTYNETAAWLIFTSEANATEFFEDKPYQRLREGFEVLVTLERTISHLMNDITLGESAKRETAQILAMAGINQLRTWSQRSGIAGNLSRFKDDYITGKITYSDLGSIRVDGMYATFSYSHTLDRLEIEMDLPEGRVVLSAIGISVPPVRFEGLVITPSGVSLNLDTGDGTFLISGSIDGHPFTEGSARIKTPPAPVLSLMIHTDWTITSPNREFQTIGENTPFRTGFTTDEIPDLSYAFLISGGEELDPAEIIPLLSEDEVNSEEEMYTHITASSLSIASILDGLQSDPWMGFSVRSEGGDTQPFSRTLWFRAGSDTGLLDIMRDHSIQSTLKDMLWLPNVDLPNPNLRSGAILSDIILVKETTTRTIPVQGEVDATDIIILSHLSTENDLTIWSFSEDSPQISPYSHIVDDWSRATASNPSPLW